MGICQSSASSAGATGAASPHPSSSTAAGSNTPPPLPHSPVPAPNVVPDGTALDGRLRSKRQLVRKGRRGTLGDAAIAPKASKLKSKYFSSPTAHLRHPSAGAIPVPQQTRASGNASVTSDATPKASNCRPAMMTLSSAAGGSSAADPNQSPICKSPKGILKSPTSPKL